MQKGSIIRFFRRDKKFDIYDGKLTIGLLILLKA